MSIVYISCIWCREREREREREVCGLSHMTITCILISMTFEQNIFLRKVKVSCLRRCPSSSDVMIYSFWKHLYSVHN